APLLTVPSSSSSGTYTVSWSAVSPVTRYELVGESSGTIYSGTSRSVVRTKPNGVYGYKVRACNGSGTANCSAYTAIKSITVDIPIPTPAPPVVSVPATSTGSHTVSWTSPAHAVRFIVRESGTQIYDGSSLSKFMSGRPNGSYTYSARSCNADNSCSSWSAGATTVVTVAPSTPSTPLLSVPSSSSSGTYTVSWSAVSPVTRYELVGESSGTIYSGTSRSVVRTKPTGIYGYKVRACNGSGTANCSAYTAIKSMRVSLIPAVPTLSAPSTSSGTYVVSWGATYPSSTYKLFENGSVVSSSAALSVNRTKSSGSYTYQVQGCNSLGDCGGLSSAKTVVVSTCDPNAWTPDNGLTEAETAAACPQGQTYTWSQTNECGDSDIRTGPCTGCDPNSWSCTYGYGQTIAQCAAACTAPNTFPITNDCGTTHYYGNSAGQCTGQSVPEWSGWMINLTGPRYYYQTTNCYYGGCTTHAAYWNSILIYSATKYGSNQMVKGNNGTVTTGGYTYDFEDDFYYGPYTMNSRYYRIRRIED
ncbi:hypothetical protein N9V62_06990, partial [Porticoccaceae bacterium]|nr:hypothetical protein [Porticoccaceae bacterium]